MPAEANSFTEENTLMTKGILIIRMLIHHVIVADMIGTYGVSITLSDARLSVSPQLRVLLQSETLHSCRA